jgi:hypothetical protein
MFPHPCGAALEQAAAAGTPAATVVPDEYIVARGGTKPVPPPGTPFSASVGPTLPAAACAVPHGQLAHTTAGAIRAGGGSVVWVPQHSQSGIMNYQHVHATEGAVSSFSVLIPNPVPKADRVA